MANETDHGEIVLYQVENGVSALDVHLKDETVWLTQTQMVELFQKTKQNISLHIRNIFREGELLENSVVKEYLTTAADGKKYKTKYYNLDVIISVGYRVKSQRGTQFRIWATSVLKDHPFLDGNKRIGTFLFILFLRINGLLARQNFDNKSLVALALLTAASDPGQKGLLVRLIVNLLAGGEH